MTTIRLAPHPRSEMTANSLIDLLWLHAMPPDGIKHIHARAGPAHIDVVMFTVASEQGIADFIVRTVCHRALTSTPALHGWQVV